MKTFFISIISFLLISVAASAQTSINLPQACECPAGPDASTNGTGVVSAYGGSGCTGNGTINGTMTAGTPVSGVTMALYANVTTLGTYSLSATANGVTFSKSGTFTTLGCQLITLTSTGTPTAAGTNTFTTNTTPSGSAPGTTVAAAGSIATLNCAGATNTGTLTGGTAASGVSSSISYTGGNGGTHAGQTVTSTGVTGLTATLTAGSFATGAGSLVYNITGTPSAAGTASFAISIGGQTCPLTRTVADAVVAPTFPTGTGAFGGKICFDVAISNNNTNGCGPLAGRTAQQANFNLPAINTQVYTFTPTVAVTNIAFVYVNTNGTPIASISAPSATSAAANTPVTATVIYETANNANATGLTNANPLTADIYVTYKEAGVDKQLKITPNIKDCQCCGAYVSATVWKEFMCHNLGADTSLDPNVLVQGIHGNYYQWGRSTVVANASTSAAAISGWNTTDASNGAWSDATKTAKDPCPAGYRVPTNAQWVGVANAANNTRIFTGTFTNSATNFGSGISFGPNGTTKTLTLPAAGNRNYFDGGMNNHGYIGYYWSSTGNGPYDYYLNFSSSNASTTDNISTNGFSVRCISE